MAQCEFIRDEGMMLPSPDSPKKYRYYLVKCGNCSKEFLTQARFYKKGGIKSCRDCASGLRENKGCNKTHGLSGHPLYDVWAGMKSRCSNKSNGAYHNYGGRGVKVLEPWLSDFKSFYDWATSNGYEKGLEIDRINNDGSYCAENCRIVTRNINILNQRPMKKSNTSGFRGVFKYGKTKRFYARIMLDGKFKILGVFDKPEDASAAYEAALTLKMKDIAK